MSTYVIGDVHGCYYELLALLKKIKFSPNQDKLWLSGDLVARGTGSLEVLRYIKSIDRNVHIVLGNHDLTLLAIYTGIISNNPNNHLTSLLKATDADELLNWLRCQSLLHIDEDKKLIMVHAGINPNWNLKIARKYACIVENFLSSESYPLLLKKIFSNKQNEINNCYLKYKSLSFFSFIINSFTRMRYCFSDGKLCMYYKQNPEENTNPHLKPWFQIPMSITSEYNIVFGHWSSLMGKGTPDGIYALDTGCCWGGKLTCLRWEDKRYFTQSSLINNHP